jgi:TolB-like protein
MPLCAQAEKRPKLVVLAVRPIDDAVRGAAQVLTEKLSTDLSKTGRFELISETEIGSMLGFERQKTLLGCTEASCLAEIGGALGCDYLLIGTLGRLGEQMRFDLKIADARRNQIVARDGALVASVSKLASVERTVLQSVLAQLGGPAARSAPVAGVEEGASESGLGPWLLMGGGAAGMLAGAGYTALVLSNRSQQTYDAVNTRASVGLWVGGLGAAALAAGLVWKLGAGDDPAAISLAPAPGTVGVVAAGRF